MRYNKKEKIINNSSFYKDLFYRKNLKQIDQYSLFEFGDLKNFKNLNLDKVEHIIQPFDRLYNISYKYYKTPEYGWLICYTNNISNEFEINIGDKLNIYFPLETLLDLL